MFLNVTFLTVLPKTLVMMSAKLKVALLLMILATEEYFTTALMWHLNLF